MPALNPNDRQYIEQINNMFTGQPETVLVEAKPDEEEEIKDDDDNENAEKDSFASDDEKVPPKNFTELDRLAFVVRAID